VREEVLERIAGKFRVGRYVDPRRVISEAMIAALLEQAPSERDEAP
jgi:hypothetical protein